MVVGNSEYMPPMMHYIVASVLAFVVRQIKIEIGTIWKWKAVHLELNHINIDMSSFLALDQHRRNNDTTRGIIKQGEHLFYIASEVGDNDTQSKVYDARSTLPGSKFCGALTRRHV